jgi:hypothetical protein
VAVAVTGDGEVHDARSRGGAVQRKKKGRAPLGGSLFLWPREVVDDSETTAASGAAGHMVVLESTSAGR